MTYGPTFEDLHLPYFVYGTLRPDWGNSRRWRNLDGTAWFDGVAYVSGYQMVDHGIPYAVRSTRWSDRVIGCLIVPARRPGTAVLAAACSRRARRTPASLRAGQVLRSC